MVAWWTGNGSVACRAAPVRRSNRTRTRRCARRTRRHFPRRAAAWSRRSAKALPGRCRRAARCCLGRLRSPVWDERRDRRRLGPAPGRERPTRARRSVRDWCVQATLPHDRPAGNPASRPVRGPRRRTAGERERQQAPRPARAARASLRSRRRRRLADRRVVGRRPACRAAQRRPAPRRSSSRCTRPGRRSSRRPMDTR